MERLRKILGPLGLVLILIGGVTYGIFFTSGWFMFLPLLAGLALVAVSFIIEIREERAKGLHRTARFGINAGVSIMLLAAILIFLQTLSSRHSARLDTTENKRFSLAPQTVRILEQLAGDVSLVCFFKHTTGGRQELEDLLVEYEKTSPRISYMFVDPDKDPVTARRYAIKKYGTIVVESGEMEEKITGTTEEKLTNAVVRVTRDKKKVICFLTGHGEKSIADAETGGLKRFKEAVEADNYDVRELLTLREERVPENCEILVVAGPEKDLLPSEKEIIIDYLSGGGKALFLLEPVLELPVITEIISGYGIEIGHDVIVDRFGKVLAGNFLTPVVNVYSDHPITKNFNLASFFPQARSIRGMEKPPAGVSVRTIASTGSSAYAETNIKTLLEGISQFEGESDIQGPVHIAAVATKSVEKDELDATIEGGGSRSRVVVFGDSDFANNAYLNLSGNKDLIMNTINWLAEEKDLIAIRPRDPMIQPIILTARQGRFVFWLPVIGLPAFAAVLGIIAALNRRRAA